MTLESDLPVAELMLIAGKEKQEDDGLVECSAPITVLDCFFLKIAAF